jgi:hypothetical protein
MQDEQPEPVSRADAAAYLNVSPEYVDRLLEQGALIAHPTASGSAVHRNALAAYKREDDARRDAVLDELARLSQEMGLYDVTPLSTSAEHG